MNLLDQLMIKLTRRRELVRPPAQKATPPQAPARRNIFAGADLGRLYASWTTTNHSADAELWRDLGTLRARSRELVRNNDYAKGFVSMVKTNVIGPRGIRLQSQAMKSRKEPDPWDRSQIEGGWKAWSAKGVCDVTGKYSLRDIQNLVIQHVITDGEVLVRKVRGFDNDFGFALQLIEADHLDHRYNDTLPDGRRVKMGVELDAYNRPIAYWVHPRHPGDNPFGYTHDDRVRIPADEILHLFIPSRISANRGVPWMAAALTRLNMLGGYEEAELVAARTAAAKLGFLYNEEGAGQFLGDDIDESDNSPILDGTPGSINDLPAGKRFVGWDPTHPNTAFDAFIKAILRGVSAGLQVPYFKLGADLEGVNYTSSRSGELDVRSVWRELQEWLIEHFLHPVYLNWLDMALLSGAVPLPFSKFEKYTAVVWRPRGWAWVDPKKDAEARMLEIENGLSSYSQAAADAGFDLEEILQQLAADREMMAKYGVNPSGLKPQGTSDEQAEQAEQAAAN